MANYNAAEWLLDRNVDQGRGASIALRCRGASIDYDDVLRQTWRVQNALADLSVGGGERVLMVVNDEPEFVAWFLGCERSGVVAVPVSTMATAADIAMIAADSAAVLLVVSEQYADRVPVIVAAAPSLRNAVVIGDIAEGASTIPVHPWAQFDNILEASVAPTVAYTQAFWLYSSGTTGVPKGVIHGHANQQATFDTYASRVLEVRADDRFLSVAKLFFAYGLGNSLTFPFGAGATSILEPRRPTPLDIAALVVEEKPTLFFASPGFVAALLDAELPPDTFESVRCTVTAGEALPAELQQRFSTRFGHPVLDGIGSTEALHIFLSNTLDDQRPGTSGTVVPGYAVALRDDNDQPVIASETAGYLYVSGPSIALGYWQRDDATAATFRDNWLRTGDVYTRSDDDHWTFLGRNSDMIKAGGIWVSPAEVEAVLVEHPDVLEAAVVGARNSAGLEETVAFVVPRSGHTIDRDSIDAHCRERMAGFKRPRQLVIVDELPKTATGKIRRFALRETLTDGSPADTMSGVHNR
jgi:benzoate-CoA ligase family protein